MVQVNFTASQMRASEKCQAICAYVRKSPGSGSSWTAPTNLKSRVRAENALKQLEASPLWATVHASMIEYVGMPVSCYGEAAWGHVRLTRM